MIAVSSDHVSTNPRTLFIKADMKPHPHAATYRMAGPAAVEGHANAPFGKGAYSLNVVFDLPCRSDIPGKPADRTLQDKGSFDMKGRKDVIGLSGCGVCPKPPFHV